MIIYTNDTKKIYDIQLRVYRDSCWTPGFEPDCFSDLECNFINDCCTENGDGRFFASDADVQDLIAWWEGEVRKANDDPYYEGDGLNGFGNHADTKEWVFSVETEDYDEI